MRFFHLTETATCEEFQILTQITQMLQQGWEDHSSRADGRDSAGWNIRHFLCELHANGRTMPNSHFLSNQATDSLTKVFCLPPALDIITTVFRLKVMVTGG